MRVRITFRVKNRGVAIPFHHQFLIAQVIKGLILSSRNQRFKDFVLYSFSGLKGQTKVSRNGLHFNSSRVTLVITSPEQEFIDFLLGQVFGQSQIDIGPLVLNPEQADAEIPLQLSTNEKYICISPLVILESGFNSSDGKKFVEPGTDEFSDILYESTVQRMEASGIRTDEIQDIDKFQLVPDKGYIEKLRQAQKKFARIYPMYDQDVKYEVRGYTFPFVLYAPKEVQQFVFTCGLGLFTQKGFGMMDMANADPIKRVTPYEVRQQVTA
ncbi:MAG: CRISPR-associated protein Cas6 [Cyclobacteriaceae bacterium]|nr:CRISPR-associated protein Cas6 [Cyclobacteriaceae bacterium]